MSSILTNTGAMVALQTLKGINSGLSRTQNDISTGKAIASAKDNAAIWAISKTMESDVAGFKGISDSLALGASTVAVARSASEKITDLLTEMKQKIVASQEENQDRTKIQQDIVALRDQIGSIAGAAQFNGLNMLSKAEGGGTVSILSSLDRSSTGTVASSFISTSKHDLGTNEGEFGTGAALAAAASTVTQTTTGSAVRTIAIAGDDRGEGAVVAGDSYRITSTPLGGTAATLAEYVAGEGDTIEDVAAGLTASITNTATADPTLTWTATVSNGTISLTWTGATPGAGTAQSASLAVVTATEGEASGGLAALNSLDVTTAEGATGALGSIEGMIQTAITAAAEFGSAQKRIEIQADFVKSLSDSLKSGIGALVDADMEEASARLQAMQVQQQLGIQALSIANQAPQNILALFR